MPKARKTAESIRTVAFVSLGCPKNLVDSERMLGLLAEDGLVITSDAAAADAIVINTCGFLEASKEESLREIRQAIALKESGACHRVVVAGCLVQRHKARLLEDAPGIDRLVGVFDREHIVQAVRGRDNPRQAHGHFLGKYHDLSKRLQDEAQDEIHKDEPADAKPASPFGVHRSSLTLPVFEDDRARLRLTPRHYAYLRISEGCNQGCSFCTIPSIRGPMRSKPPEQILAEAAELAADGAVELNLIGQDTTSYGTDIGYAAGLSGLLAMLDKRLPADVQWVRLMYAYPSCFTDQMIRTIADAGRVVKYIDIPLQHINDQMLTRMRRRVTRAQIELLLDKLRRWVPDIAIRTTFIAGAPGETDEQHEELVRFVREFGFDMVGVFAYSRESGTPMGRSTDQVPEAVRRQRAEQVMLAQQPVAFAKAASLVGRRIEVLVDKAKGRGTWVGRTRSQAPDIDGVVRVSASREAVHAGALLDMQVTAADGYDLVAGLPGRSRRSLAVLPAPRQR